MLLEEKARRLVDLAEKAFPPLGEAELKMLRAAALGEEADLRAGNDAEDDPAGAKKWGADHAVRAELLRWLCTEHEASVLVAPRGVQVAGVQIDGELDLSCADVPFRLAFPGCAFPAGLNLRDARLPGLFLNGSHTGPIAADRVNVTGSVSLRDKFHATGVVRLLGASVGGNLECRGGIFEGGKPDGTETRIALSADGIQVTGTVFLDEGFRASGEVRFLGARVGGTLECSGGRFENPGGNALSADRIDVNGGVFLRGRFHASGEVRFLGARVGGTLECNGGRFENPGGNALSADRIDVNGGVFLRGRFHATGVVRLLGASVGGDLDCSDGTFENPNGAALSADGIRVTGGVFLRQGFRASGMVRLLGAMVGGNLACRGGIFEGGKARLPDSAETQVALGADGIQVTGDVFLDQQFRASGMVRLLGASIGGDLACCGGIFEGGKVRLPDGTETQVALSADGIQVTGSVFLHEGFRASGEVRLLGASVGGNLACRGGTFENPGGWAINAEGARIGRGLLVRGKKFGCDSGMNLAYARVRVLADARASWPERGELVLDGFTYDALHEPWNVKDRLKWLERQYPAERKEWRGAFRPQPYDQLAAVLRRMGHEAQATGVLVGKQRHRRKYGTMGKCARVWNWLMGATIGHGYKVGRVAWWALGLWLLGALILWQGYGADLIVRSGSDEATPSGAEFSPWIYSLDVLLPVVDLHQEAHWRPDPTKGCTILGYEAARAGQAIRCWVWLEILGGWVLATLAVAGLSGIAQRRYP